MFRYFLVNNVKTSFSADDDAVYAALFDGGSDFHFSSDYTDEFLITPILFLLFLLFTYI